MPVSSAFEAPAVVHFAACVISPAVAQLPGVTMLGPAPLSIPATRQPSAEAGHLPAALRRYHFR